MSPVVPELPPEIPRDGNVVTEWIGRTLLRLFRWRIVGTPPALSKMVIVAGPHTSAWDVIFALIGKLALRIDVRFMAKHTLFYWPLGSVLRGLGCVPIDRTGPHNVVDQMTEQFATRESFLLVLAPEGTRQRVDRWKSGFYHIARGADVPIVPAALDFGNRQIRFGPAVHPAGDVEAEVGELKAFIASVRGKRPELA